MVRFAGIPYTQPAAAADPAGLTVSNRRLTDPHPGPDRPHRRFGQFHDVLPQFYRAQLREAPDVDNSGRQLGIGRLDSANVVGMVLLLALVITL